MARRQKIPTPLRQRWRQFRYQVLPLASFLVATVLAVYIWRQQTRASHVVGAVVTQEVIVNAGTDGTLVSFNGGQKLELFDEVLEGQLLVSMDDEPLKRERAILLAQRQAAEEEKKKVADEIAQETQRLVWEDFDRKWDIIVQNSGAQRDAMRLLAGIKDLEASIVGSELESLNLNEQERGLEERIAKVDVLINGNLEKGKEIARQLASFSKQGDGPPRFVDPEFRAELERELAEVIATYKANVEVKKKLVGQQDQLKAEHQVIDQNRADRKEVLNKLLAEVDEASLSSKIKQELKNSPFVAPDDRSILDNIQKPDLAARFAPLDAQVKTYGEMIAQIDTQMRKLEIRAPFSGKVTMIHAYPGQAVTNGGPVITIAASQGQFIVTYLRQSHRYRPQPKDVVEIRTRTSPIEFAQATVEDIGAQVVAIPPDQLLNQQNQEWGLPIKIAMPQDLAAKLRPGELVDIRFPPKPADALPANTLAPGTLVGSVLAPSGK